MISRHKTFLYLFLITASTLIGCNKISSDDVATEPLEISFGYWNIDEMEDSSESDGITSFLQDKFNFKAIPMSFSWTNYKERYQILSTTNSLPDVFATITISSNATNDTSSYEDMIRSGTIRALPDDLSAYPNLEKLLSDVPFTKYKDGHYYAVPRLSFSDISLSSSDASILVRRDWMDTLGISNPESIEDFIDMTKAFATMDPNQNGVDDTIGYNVNNLNALGKWLILGIAPECNVYTWIEASDGTFIPSWFSDDFANVVSTYRTLYDEGSLDPDFYTKTPSTVLQDFASGRLGALEYKSSPNAILELELEWNKYNDKPFSECVDVLPIFPASDGIRYSNSSNPFWSESYISSSVSDEKLERILALYDYLLSDEGQHLCDYGFEDEDYRYNSDGEFECLLDLNNTTLSTALDKKYPSISLWGGLVTWGGSPDDFALSEENLQRFGEDSISLANKDLIYNQENTTQVQRPFSFLVFPKENSDVMEEAFNRFIQCIIGTDDVDVMWQQAISDFKVAGLDEYIQSTNEAYQESQK